MPADHIMNDEFAPLEPDLVEDIYSVSSLVRETKSLLEMEFGSIWVEGEVSNLARPASGHLYFTLKDERAQVRCALFRGQRTRLRTEPENGMLVRVRARVSLYEPRGDFQLIVNRVEPAGAGALQQAYEKLKQKLLAEGLFDSEHKQDLPSFPKRLGVITSSSGAVIHDILTTLNRRFPAIEVILFPVPVQGGEAAPKIIEALDLAQAHDQCDALILARGGGSLEDLWAFNEESLARALFDCNIPLVSSIGHETDFTIADFVADVRAPTPTAAAEMLSPDWREVQALLEKFESRLTRSIRDLITMNSQAVDLTAKRLVHPGKKVRAAFQQLDSLKNRIRNSVRQRITVSSLQLEPLAKRLINSCPDKHIKALESETQEMVARLTRVVRKSLHARQLELSSLVRQLNTLNPLETLGRGFAIFYTEDGKNVIDRANKATVGERGLVRLADGRVRCLIEEVNEED